MFGGRPHSVDFFILRKRGSDHCGTMAPGMELELDRCGRVGEKERGRERERDADGVGAARVSVLRKGVK